MSAALARIALALSVALPGAAAAAVPTDAEVKTIQQLLGFDTAIRNVIAGKIDKAEEFKTLSGQERGCIRDQVLPPFEAQMRDSFRTLFGDGETIAAWSRFGQTAGGAKFFAGMRQQVNASIDRQVSGQAPQPDVQFFKDMNAEELQQVMLFMQSPAAAVLQRDFPDTAPDEAEIDQLVAQVAQRCGVSLER